ncbi:MULTISPECIES: enoyl-CoA hydratase/isomerase family protein [Psychrobacter]|jgi:enoyl-CoA hydratase/carnithine racemase|uniref:3-hydroxyisobutyryl-CoA hydrolase n=2 Tax=root TaxID=1 RepID=A0A1G6XVB0_9GAMM|nr:MULTISPECIES: enoyl-CoA hydratase/isomerase family protein [Psychrobacter]MED6318121.1 enoyl-CoA hydratase/isomerase family protein [Pseudomonadota bacterium]GLR29870.1 enoyl-CoA hydratase [Psychrobacter pacificensis]SDD81355.1 Enoyl-CoA hydratase/isomerase [Psychrobacter pacificensis]HBL96139.1 enoyl-CoA hydratase/isomerase family protein [Psychrobacter sp.]
MTAATDDTQNSSNNTEQEASVLFNTEPTDCGHLIGIMTLNTPKSLNALSVDMCQLLAAQLEEWQADDQVVAIVLKGAGDKAFCAGGDIRKLYDSMSTSAPIPNPYATEFFSHEYRLYRQMHFYSKPLILWGDGIIMGGGMGLMAGCSHRIVTERTRFAMPEITIGLFPDASGSWFLQRMPAKTGLFLGLTGAMCNANDALLANLAEYAVASHDYDAVIQRLKQSDWQTLDSASSSNKFHHNSAHSIVGRALAELPVAELSDSKLATYWQPIQKLMNSGGLADIDALLQSDEALVQLNKDFSEDSWTQRAVATYRHGCPVTAALTYALYHKVADLSIEQVLYLEANVAVHCAANPDFKEGVRALLIDKDKDPQWSRSLADCVSVEGQAYIDKHFANPYPKGEHPLEDWLGEEALGSQYVR